ncbi:MAG: TerD family protein [Betaproteobacteria bacterium]
MNDIYLRRRGKVHVKVGSGGATDAQVASVQCEAEALGYVLSDEVVERLQTLSILELTQFLRSLTTALRALVGAHRPHVPLYPNFPLDVLLASEATLYLNAVSHYLTLSRLTAERVERPPLLNGRAPRPIALGTSPDFETIFASLARSKTSLSVQDKEDLAWFVRQYRADIHRIVPEKIDFKENLAHLAAQLWRHAEGEQTTAFIASRLKTPTDVLRWVVGLNDGDVSLALPTKFRSMKRRERRLVLERLEACGDPTEDMRRWAEPWKRLGEMLHPGEFAQRFPATSAAFTILRDKLPFASFNSQVERQLASRDVEAALATLAARPGELARRLDVLLRGTGDPAAVSTAFERAAGKASTPVLLQVLAHFRHRADPSALRTFFPKGDAAKVFATRDRRVPIAGETCLRMVAVCEQALIARFSTLPSLGRCHVDPVLANYLVPLTQRAASKALRTLVRGSRLPLPDSRFVRLFLWWKNGRGRTDIDLSAAFYGTEFDFIDQVAYYRLKNYGAYHSGDIVDAPQGAAEFIDLDIDRLRAGNVRFVVASLSSYTAQPYCDLPECFAGWMARSDANSGEAFEPRTVFDRVDLASDTQLCVPFAFDLERCEVLWMDVGLTHGIGWINLNNNLSGIALVLRAISALRKPDLRTLFTLHAKARGSLVENAAEADTVFGPTSGITPFDVDRIRADFL